MIFSKQYQNCSLPNNEHLNLTYVEAVGDDFEELLDNCMISLEDWHGNEGPEWDLGDLPDSIISMIERDITESLAAQAEQRMIARLEMP